MTTASGAGAAKAGLSAMFSWLLTAAGGLVPSDESAPPVRLKTAEQRAAADRVLAAADRTELVDLLDQELPQLWGGNETVADKSPPPGKGKSHAIAALLESQLDMKSLRLTLGDPNAEKCADGLESLKAFVRHVWPIVEAVRAAEELEQDPPEPKTPSVEVAKFQSVADILYSEDLPLRLRRGALVVARSLAAMYVIGRAEEFGRKLPAWLALALSEEFAAGFHLLAKLPELFKHGADSVIDQLRAEHEAQKAFKGRLETWREEAEKRPDRAYFPNGHLDH